MILAISRFCCEAGTSLMLWKTEYVGPERVASLLSHGMITWTSEFCRWYKSKLFIPQLPRNPSSSAMYTVTATLRMNSSRSRYCEIDERNDASLASCTVRIKSAIGCGFGLSSCVSGLNGCGEYRLALGPRYSR